MPNWCATNLRIVPDEGTSKKQMKKLFKRITGEKEWYDTIVDIPYDDLFYLDRVNEYFSEDENRVAIANMILENIAIKEKTEPIDIKEVLKTLYDVIRKNKQEWSMILPSDATDKNVSIIKLVTDLYNVYKDYIKPIVSRDNKYTDDMLNTFKLMPDNPLSTYRMGHMKNHSILDDEYISMGTHVDDWYKSRAFVRLGTKWNPATYDSNFDKETGEITFKLDCAWSPCIEFCKALTEIYDVIIYVGFSEMGIGIVGTNIIQDGEIVDGESYDDLINDNMLSVLYYEAVALNTSDEEYKISKEELVDILNECIFMGYIDGLDVRDFSNPTIDITDYISRKKCRKIIFKFIDDSTIPEKIKKKLKKHLKEKYLDNTKETKVINIRKIS